MGLFDNLKNSLKNEVNKAVQNASNKTENIVFSKLPDTLEEFKALPQACFFRDINMRYLIAFEMFLSKRQRKFLVMLFC